MRANFTARTYLSVFKKVCGPLPPKVVNFDSGKNRNLLPLKVVDLYIRAIFFAKLAYLFF